MKLFEHIIPNNILTIASKAMQFDAVFGVKIIFYCQSVIYNRCNCIYLKWNLNNKGSAFALPLWL